MVDNGASPQEAFRDAFANFLGVPTATVALGVESDKGEPPPPGRVETTPAIHSLVIEKK